MPTYDYVCEACGHEFEHFQSMSDKHLLTCPKCKKKKLVRKVGAGAGLIFKGTGFYITDYKKSASSPVGDAATSKSGGEASSAPAAGSGAKAPDGSGSATGSTASAGGSSGTGGKPASGGGASDGKPSSSGGGRTAGKAAGKPSGGRASRGDASS